MIMQMTMRPASVAPPPCTYSPPPVQAAAGFDAAVVQAHLNALPEGVKYWLDLHSLKDLQALIMQQYPPVLSVMQSPMQATSYDHCSDRGLKRKAVDSDGAIVNFILVLV